METKWTKAQQQVIDLRDRNILVSAAAGSGKTAVLVERIIRKITDEANPVDIDRLLVVTFTNAAAAQMRERIEKAIEEKLSQEQDNPHLHKQMMLVHSAQITTIHSFCMNLIRNYFHVIDLDPGFRLADEAELTLLRSDVLGELLERKYEEAGEDFLELIEYYSTGKSDAKLEELILKLHGFSVSYPWPEEWLLSRRDSFRIETAREMEQAPWMQWLLGYIRFILEELPERIGRAMKICAEPDGPAAYREALASDEELIMELLRKESYGELWESLSNLKWEKLKRVSRKDGVDEARQERVKNIRQEVKDGIEDIRKSFFFQDPDDMAADLWKTAAPMNTLVDLAIAFRSEFQAEKEKKHILDFSDLEHFALHILVEKKEGEQYVPTPVAEELSGYYDEILIDEYQDSNLVQELLLKSLSKERRGRPNLFMVGDVKQSIYKFRLARPELFMEKYESYTRVEDGESKNQRIDLKNNFRSRGEVLEFANFVFRQIMQKKLGKVAYDEDAALYPGMEYQPCEGEVSRGCECLLVYREEEEGKERTGLLPGAREMEGKAIAGRIRQLVDGETGLLVYDKEKEGYRIAGYGDIVILLRTMAGWAEDFQEILMSEGIPAYTDTQSGYFETVEVKTMLNMLSIIDNPRQDIPLAAVLHSPIGEFTAQELALIRASCPGAEFYDGLLAYGEGGQEEALKEKAASFLTRLETYRKMVPFTDIHKLLQLVMEDTGYYDYASVMPAGEQRKANLDMLVGKAVEFEASSYRGLFHFNRYMERLHKYEIDFGEAGSEHGGEAAVRLMSIHKSKGLEFPIVILGAMGKSFNTQDSRSSLLIHPDLGLGPDFVDSRLRVKTATLLKKVIQKQLVLENLGEELRVLYVAFTRAKEKLILTGAIEKKEETEKKWREEGERQEEAMPFHKLSSARNYLDWVGPALYFPGSAPFTISYRGAAGLTVQELKRQSGRFGAKEELLHWDSGREYDGEWRRRLEEAMDYQYPYGEEAGLPGKITVTELKRLAYVSEEEDGELRAASDGAGSEEGQGEEEPVPRFRKGEVQISRAQRGTLYHKVMESLDFQLLLRQRGTIGLKDSLEEEFSLLSHRGKIGPEGLPLLQAKDFEVFLHTRLAERMAAAQAAGRLYREKKFVMGIPCQELYPELAGDNLVLVQGMIDAYFEEEDGLVLLDYKTDRVAAKGEEILIRRYQVQMHYYEEALSRLTRKKVKERYLYSFALGEAIRL